MPVKVGISGLKSPISTSILAEVFFMQNHIFQGCHQARTKSAELYLLPKFFNLKKNFVFKYAEFLRIRGKLAALIFWSISILQAFAYYPI